jgi:hypothetical protein
MYQLETRSLFEVEDGAQEGGSTLHEIIVPNVLMSTKNVARGIGGQIRFMAAAVQRFGSIRRYRALAEPRSERVMTFSD